VTIGQTFDESVDYYDEWVKIALPCYDEIFSVAKELIPFTPDARIEVLDLGAGTGLFSMHVLQKHPNASFVLYDVAPKMLDLARERFKQSPSRFQFIVDDYRYLRSSQRFDLVVSSLSIHHLTDSEKKNLFQRIYAALRNEGVFINVDQIRGPTPPLQELYWTKWLEMVREQGAAEEKISESIQRRMRYDKDALLTEQLQWLKDAGFSNVDCVYKNYFIGVFVATKQQDPQ
jgi:tRNA (cmo5U34)-methyltransferase